jgi:hypothetical protein
VYYPRWAPDLAFGYGYPLFDFAPPLPYFVAGILHVSGLSLENSIKLLSVLAMAAYGLGMYLFARNVLGRRAALVAGAAFLFTPFRFREVMLYGGNYPQILAIALFPWVLWAFERVIVDGRRRYVPASVVSYGALMCSHNFHTLIFTPLLVLYILAIVFFRSARLPAGGLFHRLWQPRPFVALALALGVTAFFWAPALHDVQYTAAQADYYLERSDFRLRLLDFRDLVALPVPLDARADNPDVPFSLGSAVLVLALLGVLYLGFLLLRFARAGPDGDDAGERPGWEALHLAFFLAVLLGACFLMLRPAAPLWERLPFLPYAEFPWRLMGLANLGAAFLAGGSLRLWERLARDGHGRFQPADIALAVSLLALVLAVAVYFYPSRDFLHWGTPTLSDYVQYEVGTQNVGTTGLAEYLPRWAEQTPTSSPLVSSMRDGKKPEKLDPGSLPDGAQVTLLSHTGASDRYGMRSPVAFRAHFFTFFFPGWRAYLDGNPVGLYITQPLGLMAVDVPAGEHELLLRFGETPFRLSMDMLSIATLLGLGIWLLSGWVGEAKGRRRAMLPIDGQLAHFSPIPAWSYMLSGVLLVALIVAKLAWIDPQTDWFRRESPPDRVVGIQHPMHIRLEDNILFLGYDSTVEDRTRPGGPVGIRLYWQATGPVQGDYVSFVHLDAPPDHATFVTHDNYIPGDPQAQIDVPSTLWKTTLYTRDEHRIQLPGDLPPIAYSLCAGLYDRQTGRRLSVLAGEAAGPGEDTVFLQQLHVKPSSWPSRLSFFGKETYLLGDSIQLLGYRIGKGDGGRVQRLQAGDLVGLTLYWQTLDRVPDYTVFVHVLDAAGQLRAQRDGPPMNGRYPTSNWLPHQPVEDRVDLALPADLPPGDYSIVVGMYEPATGQRLAVRAAGGEVPNQAVVLEPLLRVGD